MFLVCKQKLLWRLRLTLPQAVVVMTVSLLCTVAPSVTATDSVTHSQPQGQCTRSCKMSDRSPDCWLQSMDFFTVQLQKSMREYAAVLTLMNRWRVNLQDEISSAMDIEIDKLEQISMDKMLKSFQELPEDERNPLEVEDIHVIFKNIINKTSRHFPQYADINKLGPWASCPVPCQYYAGTWANLSYVLIACLLLLSTIFFLHTCYTSRRADRLGKLHYTA